MQPRPIIPNLIDSGPDLAIPDPMLLHHLYLGLNKEATHYLDIALGGPFLHLTSQGGKDVLNKILENTPYTVFMMNSLKKKL